MIGQLLENESSLNITNLCQIKDYLLVGKNDPYLTK